MAHIGPGQKVLYGRSVRGVCNKKKSRPLRTPLGSAGVNMRRIRLDPPITPIGGPLREQCPLHLLPGGGRGARGAERC